MATVGLFGLYSLLFGLWSLVFGLRTRDTHTHAGETGRLEMRALARVSTKVVTPRDARYASRFACACHVANHHRYHRLVRRLIRVKHVSAAA